MWDLDSTFAAFSRAVIQVAQLNEKLIVRFPELQAVVAIARLRRQLNRREILDTFCHGDLLDLIVLCSHIVLCVVNTKTPRLPLRFGLPNVNGTRAREAKKSLFPPGLSTNFPREREGGREPRPSNLLAVVFEPELRRIGLPLVGSPNPALHLVLHSVERVDLDQRFVLSAFDAPVQAGQAAVHRIAEDVRDRLARPGPTGLRAVSIPVELLADLGDAFALEIASENQRDHAGLLVLHLEHAVYIVVAVRTRVSPERVRLLHPVIECLRALQSSGPAQHLALVQVPFDAQFPKRLVLRLRRIVLKHLAG